jgi:hypothetical protein
MKKILFALHLFFVLLNSPAIAHANQKDSVSLWSIGLQYSIDHYYYSFSNLENSSTDSKQYYQARSFNFSKGISLTRVVTKKLNAVSGIFVSEKGFNRITNPYQLPPYTLDVKFKEVKFYSYQIEVPLLLQYISHRGQGFRQTFSCGFITGVPIYERKNYIAIEGKESENTSTGMWEWNKSYPYDTWLTFNQTWRINQSIAMSAGMGYRYKKFNFLLQPMYQFYFINTFPGRLTKKPHSIHFIFEISYNL